MLLNSCHGEKWNDYWFLWSESWKIKIGLNALSFEKVEDYWFQHRMWCYRCATWLHLLCYKSRIPIQIIGFFFSKFDITETYMPRKKCESKMIWKRDRFVYYMYSYAIIYNLEYDNSISWLGVFTIAKLINDNLMWRLGKFTDNRYSKVRRGCF